MNLRRKVVATVIGGALCMTMATAIPAGASAPPIEHFTGVQTSVDGPITVVAAGPISANGTDVESGSHRGVFTFPDGTLSVRHQPVAAKQTFDTRTCVFTDSETGTYTIVKGTGAYAHASGSGTYKSFIVGQGCDRDQPPTSVVLVIAAHGPLSLG